MKAELKKVLPKLRTNKIVIKPRAGSSAKGIKFTTKKRLLKKIEKNSIVQEFIPCSGVPGFVKGISDLRIVTVNGKMIIAEIRKASKGLVSNLSKGGKDIVVDLKKVPDEVKKIVKKVDRLFKRYKPRIYTVDFDLQMVDSVINKHQFGYTLQL